MTSADNPKSSTPGEPIEVTDATLDSLLCEHNILVVDCWAPWCGPCRMIAPTIEALAKDYNGKIAFGKLNTDENMQISMKFGIMSIPTLLFFKGGKLVDRTVGALPRNMIVEHLEKLL